MVVFRTGLSTNDICFESRFLQIWNVSLNFGQMPFDNTGMLNQYIMTVRSQTAAHDTNRGLTSRYLCIVKCCVVDQLRLQIALVLHFINRATKLPQEQRKRDHQRNHQDFRRLLGTRM